MHQVTGNIEFLQNCCEKLFTVVDSYRDMLFDEGLKSREQRIEDMNNLLTSCRFDLIRNQTPTVIDEAAGAIEQVFELVQAMKGLPHSAAPELV